MTSRHLVRRSAFASLVSALLLLASATFASAATTATLLPTGNGLYAQWTPSTTTVHYTMVNESVCNGNTTYNYTDTVGKRDSYAVTLSSIPSGATITQIDISPCASRDLTGGATPVLNVFYTYNGGNSADSGSYSLSGTVPVTLATTTYSGLSYVTTATSTLQIGAILATSTNGARLSRIATVVTYTVTAPAAPSSLLANASPTYPTVSLSWKDNSSNETAFEILRSLNGTIFSHFASTTANATSYVDSSVVASTTYYYRVRAFGAGGYSSVSNTAVTSTYSAPLAPSNLAVNPSVASSSAYVSVNWTDNASGTAGFMIERAVGAGAFAVIASTSPFTTSYTDSAVVLGNTYTYRVRASNGYGYSGYSNSASTTLLAAPTSVTATPWSSSFMYVSWSYAGSAQAGFTVEQSLNGVTWNVIATSSASARSYYSFGLNPLTTYYYRIRAYSGSSYSAYSNTAIGTTLDVPPTAPTGLSATATGASTISLSWIDNSSNETGFSIERLVGTSSYMIIGTTTANATTYTDSGLSPSTSYTYQVNAFNSSGYSNYTNQASSTTFANVPATPSGLSAVASTTNPTVSLLWTDNSNNETGFEVLNSTDGITFTHVAWVGANVTSYADNAVLGSASYYYQVRAYNGNGNSGVSNTATTTTFTVPTAPDSLSVNAYQASSTWNVFLSWADNSSNETQFTVERSTDGVSFAPLAVLAPNVTSYVDTPVSGSYWYRVDAANGYGASAYSNVGTTTIP